MLRPFGRTRNAAHSLIYKQIKFRESTISRSLMATSLVCSCFFRPTHVLETSGDLFKGRTHSCKISRKTREERNWTGWYAKRTIRRECSKQPFTNGRSGFKQEEKRREKRWYLRGSTFYLATDENIERVRKFVLSNRRVTGWMIAEKLSSR